MLTSQTATPYHANEGHLYTPSNSSFMNVSSVQSVYNARKRKPEHAIPTADIAGSESFNTHSQTLSSGDLRRNSIAYQGQYSRRAAHGSANGAASSFHSNDEQSHSRRNSVDIGTAAHHVSDMNNGIFKHNGSNDHGLFASMSLPNGNQSWSDFLLSTPTSPVGEAPSTRRASSTGAGQHASSSSYNVDTLFATEGDGEHGNQSDNQFYFNVSNGRADGQPRQEQANEHDLMPNEVKAEGQTSNEQSSSYVDLMDISVEAVPDVKAMLESALADNHHHTPTSPNHQDPEKEMQLERLRMLHTQILVQQQREAASKQQQEGHASFRAHRNDTSSHPTPPSSLSFASGESSRLKQRSQSWNIDIRPNTGNAFNQADLHMHTRHDSIDHLGMNDAFNHNATSVQGSSPMTPAFFTPNFLEALNSLSDVDPDAPSSTASSEMQHPLYTMSMPENSVMANDLGLLSRDMELLHAFQNGSHHPGADANANANAMSRSGHQMPHGMYMHMGMQGYDGSNGRSSSETGDGSDSQFNLMGDMQPKPEPRDFMESLLDGTSRSVSRDSARQSRHRAHSVGGVIMKGTQLNPSMSSSPLANEISQAQSHGKPTPSTSTSSNSILMTRAANTSMSTISPSDLTLRLHRSSSLSSLSSSLPSTSSPSPPKTPVTYVNKQSPPDSHHFSQRTPTIMEEDEDMDGVLGSHNTFGVASALSAFKDSLPNVPYGQSFASFHGAHPSFQANIPAEMLKGMIKTYLMSEDPVAAGERTVMVLTSKVAQKSYGTEKRFLCPPPTTLLLGSTWWTAAQTGTSSGNQKAPLTLNPPSLTINISGENISQTGSLEWQTSKGSLLDLSSSTTTSDRVVSGRCVSKHLYINDVDEKRKRVHALVKVVEGDGKLTGTFSSQGIKVISKPSKKRQSVKNMELCIHHGTTISLFNRIRSQTVSTKYLGVSTTLGQSINYGGGGRLDWAQCKMAMFGGRMQSNSTDSNNANVGGGTCFVARTGSWDPFIIWIVDQNKTANANNHRNDEESPVKQKAFPSPPAVAIKSNAQNPIPILYNQPVVLQCLNTGLVSPIMVIRKVDKASTVVGGAHVSKDSNIPCGGEFGDEALGDPVSQLHKIAFQIVQDPQNPTGSHSALVPPPPLATVHGTMLPSSVSTVSYLACLNDIVGMNKVTEPRKPLPVSFPNATTNSSPLSANAMGVTWEDMQHELLGGDSLAGFVDQSEATAVAFEGSKVTRKRRVSCDVPTKPMTLPAKLANSKSRRRVNSLNDVHAGDLPGHLASGGPTTSSERRGSISSQANPNTALGCAWTEDVTDAAVWTIVGTDCATYTYWDPSYCLANPVHSNQPYRHSASTSTSSEQGKDGNDGSDGSSVKSGAVTPLPNLREYTVNPPNSVGQTSLTLHGDNFARDLSVWFGDVKAPTTDVRSREVCNCTVPPLEELHQAVGMNIPSNVKMDDKFGPTTHTYSRRVPLLLVRADGMVFRTRMFYCF